MTPSRSRLILLFPLLLATFSCTMKGGRAFDSAETEADADSDVDADTDSDADSDTDSDADLLTLRFEIEGTWEGATLQITNMGDMTEKPGDPLAFAPVESASATVEVPSLLESGLVAIDPHNYPELEGAFFMASLHVDQGAAGWHDTGESVVGISPASLLYLQEPVPSDLSRMGLMEGWNAFTLLDDSILLHELSEIPIEARFWPDDATTSISIGGQVSKEISAPGLALVSLLTMKALPVDSIFDDPEALEVPDWEISLTDAPPADHLFDAGDGLSSVALEFPVAYQDGNLNGYFDRADPIPGFACFEETLVVLMFLPAFTELSLAWYAEVYGFKPGWLTMADSDGEAIILDSTQASALTLSSACTPDL